MLVFPRPNKPFHVDGFREELADAGLITDIFTYEDRVEMPSLDESNRDQVLAIAQAHRAEPPRHVRQQAERENRMRDLLATADQAVANWSTLTAAQRSEIQRRTVEVTADIIRYLMRNA